jgi:nucleotide-binding universal stress UspA family protein
METVQLKRILLPTDFSPYSRVATKYACALAEKFGAELHLLHVFEEYTGSSYAPGVPLPPPRSQIEERKQEVAEALVELIDPAWRAQYRIVRATREGHPFVEIIRYVKDHAIDLIVMGTHGRTGISHLLMGSVAENVVRKALCPVLTVRPSDHQFVMP